MALEQRQREQRRYERIQLSVPARFLADGKELAGILMDISPGGLALSATEQPAPGTRIVVYVDELGRMEGRVVRHLTGGFAVKFDVTDAKRARLAQRLHSLAGLPEETVPEATPVTAVERPHFVLPDGSEIECKVLDMSVRGVSIEVRPKPAIGAEVTIGRMKGRVASHHQQGVEIEFLR